MSLKAARNALLAVFLFTLAATGSAAAQTEERGIDPNQGLSLVEVRLDSLNQAMQLQLDAEDYGIEFNDHYRRDNPDGSVTVTVFGTESNIDGLADAGYDVGVTIEGPRLWKERIAERQADVRQEKRADAAASENASALADSDELVVLRVDYFENYAGRFLSVEAKTRLGGVDDDGDYAGPDLSLSYNTGSGTPISSTPRLMAVNVDPDTTPNTYIEHRELVRIGEVGTTTPPRPTRIRIGSSTGESIEADVNTWLGGGLPPMDSRFISDFTTRYMDPTEVYARFDELAEEFPNISEMITLPNKTNGYQRKAQANMAAGTPIGNTVPGNLQGGAVVLTSRAWGHEGGNDVTAEFRAPAAGTLNSPLSVSVTGNDILVNLGTDAAGALSSTAQQVIAAINASPAARQLVVALTYRGNAGTGITQPRAKTNLSDFLTTATNAHVQRGPFEYSVMRIGKKRDGSKTGVFLYCQQHAREWATPLTCLETAERLLRNYAIDKTTRKLVDNLDIFILPSSNPDGAHYSMHNFAQQRKNMTNWCNEGGEETDDPFLGNFWVPRVNPGTGLPYTNTDPASRTGWGVDLNRNNTVGTIFDGYIGASYSCTSEVYTGPGEASEPEIKNELWIADTFTNIKFSNNIHSFGGYFMWAPGAYLPDRGEGDLEHPNIGVEQYFFDAGDRILNRIKETRNTAILPARTGPIADVLYSAGGNSADEHWYERGVIAYSFETGADRYFTNFNTTIAAGATGIRMGTGTAGFEYLKAGDKLTFGAGGANPETRTITQVVRPNPPNPQPNVIWAEPLVNTHTAPVRIEGAALQTGVGFQPDYATEGKFEALEFASGNYGLLESAFDYEFDNQGPKIAMTGPKCSSAPIETTFEFVSEPATIRYTMDGSKPDSSSPLWDSTGPREPGQTFNVTQNTEFQWVATDIKGNSSHGKEKFKISSKC
jgi:zinc carboxypeptidase/chitobiase/beta-hexosaminidase-like protein